MNDDCEKKIDDSREKITAVLKNWRLQFAPYVELKFDGSEMLSREKACDQTAR